MIDLRKVHVLRVLQARGTVTAAAAAVHLTPSAISQQIRALADELGVELLQREGRNVRLTPAAELLVFHADRLAAHWEQVRAELDAYATDETAVLRFAAFPSALARLVVPATVHLRVSHPRIGFTMTETETSECFEKLSAHEVDVAVVVPLPDNPAPDDPRFEQQPLLDDQLDLLVAARHPLAGKVGVELAEAAYEEWVAAPGNIDQHQLILAACAAAGFAPRIVHSAQEWNAICALVAGSFGVCLFPRLAPIAAEHAVVRVPLAGNPVPFRRMLTCIRRGSARQRSVALGLAALHRVAAETSGRPAGAP